jgi:hypothetical protein
MGKGAYRFPCTVCSFSENPKNHLPGVYDGTHRFPTHIF